MENGKLECHVLQFMNKVVTLLDGRGLYNQGEVKFYGMWKNGCKKNVTSNKIMC